MKKSISMIFLMIFGFLLIACQKPVQEVPNDVFDAIKITYQDTDHSLSVTKDITLTKEVSYQDQAYVVHWTSSNEAIIVIEEDKGIVTQSEETTTVILTYLVIINQKEYQDTFSVQVLKKEEKPIDPVDPVDPVDPPVLPKTYVETFDDLGPVKENGGNSSEYLGYDYTSEITGVLWELVRTRIDLFVHEDGNHALTFKGGTDEGNGVGLEGGMYATLEDGLSALSLDVKVPFETDKHAKLKIMVNEEIVYHENLATKKVIKISLENLNVFGTFDLAIIASSGHRISVDNIKWTTNPSDEIIKDEAISIDFEQERFDFDYEEQEHLFGDLVFIVKEVHTKVMHPDNEAAKMDAAIHGSVIARFRGASNSVYSTPSAYMYTKEALESIQTISFDAKHFSEYNQGGTLSVYITNEKGEWVLVENVNISLVFANYVVQINQKNVKIKIEVQDGTINIDNIKITK